LTAVWCGYFVIVAAVAAVAAGQRDFGYGRFGLAVWCGTVLLFAVEWLLRPRLFPGVAFPGLRRQVRDTWSVWRVRDTAIDRSRLSRRPARRY
jgi:hypothetical protein